MRLASSSLYYELILNADRKIQWFENLTDIIIQVYSLPLYHFLIKNRYNLNAIIKDKRKNNFFYNYV